MFKQIASKRVLSTTTRKCQQQLIPEYNNIQSGVSNVVTKSTLSSYWQDRAMFHLNKVVSEINKTAETPVEISKINEDYLKEVIDSKILTSSGRQLYLNASILNNIVFSLKSLSPSKKFVNQITKAETPNLYALIIESFGSIKEFETVLINSANSISGDGFSWLLLNIDNMGDNFVGDKSYTSIFEEKTAGTETDESEKRLLIKSRIHSLKVVNTYNAGSPHFFQKNNGIFKRTLQYMEMKTELDEIEKKILAKLDEDAVSRDISSRDASMTESAERSLEKLRVEKDRINFLMGQQNRGVPILGLDASPKFWLLDHGVNGKKNFLKELLKNTNWNIIEERLVHSLK
ncbi:hypothetical protein QEN19_000882 [Hanseniaspora menglaensis]